MSGLSPIGFGLGIFFAFFGAAMAQHADQQQTNPTKCFSKRASYFFESFPIG